MMKLFIPIVRCTIKFLVWSWSRRKKKYNKGLAPTKSTKSLQPQITSKIGKTSPDGAIKPQKLKKIFKSIQRLQKNEIEIARSREKAAVAGKLLNPHTVKRLIATSRVLSPLVIPIAYRIFSQSRSALTAHKSEESGIPIVELGRYSEKGTSLVGRIKALQSSLEDAEKKVPKKKLQALKDMRGKLDNLHPAIATAEKMPADRRNKAYDEISRVIGTLEKEALELQGLRLQ